MTTAVVDNFGYEEFYPPSTMDTEGFAVTNTFGYEEDMMLKPSEQWLKNHKDAPFMAEYFTGQDTTATNASAHVTGTRASRRTVSSIATSTACASRTSS